VGRSHRRPPEEAVPIEQWGRDHWSTLLYVESVCVDHDGIPNRDRMRVDLERHPFYGGRAHWIQDRKAKYPTRLKGGVEKHDHDDWDCVEDMVEAGVVDWIGTGANPQFALTEKGYKLAAALRQHRAESGRKTDSFEVPEWALDG
jgi:hypothetical protein